MTDRVYTVVREIIAEKEARRREPTHALYNEIHKRLSMDGLIAELQELVIQGKIEEHPTIREKSYTLTHENPA